MNRENQSAILLTQLFQQLNKDKITYCVLRNYEDLPERIENDIDIWIKDDDQHKFRAIVFDLAKKFEWEVIQHSKEYSPRLSFRGEGNYFLLKDNDGTNVIHLDCWTFLYWKGVTFVDENKFPNNLNHHKKDFFTVSPGIEASILLLKEFLYHGKVPEKYKSRIQKLVKDDSNTFLDVLINPFGFEIAAFIVNMAKDGKWNELENKSNYLRWSLIKNAILKKTFKQCKHWMIYFWGQLKKYLLPGSGIFLILIGPDGSGKSTTSEMLIESEIKKLFQRKNYFHGHFSYLPELKKIASIFSKGTKKIADESRVPDLQLKPFGMFRAMLYPLYYGIDYFLGHFFIWKEKSRGGLIVFDRYYYDYMLQKPYENCPGWLINLVGKLIPKPDILVYLRNDPETIHNRKPELSVEEIARQSKICDEIVKRSNNGVVIETSLSADDVVRSIQRIIVDKIRKKAKTI